MSERKETQHPDRRLDWRSIDLDGAELDIREKGAVAIRQMYSLWSDLCDATAKHKKAKRKKMPAELADQLAQHLSNQVADYIATFPEGTHVAVARHVVHGIFHDWMYEDTDRSLNSRIPSLRD